MTIVSTKIKYRIFSLLVCVCFSHVLYADDKGGNLIGSDGGCALCPEGYGPAKEYTPVTICPDKENNYNIEYGERLGIWEPGAKINGQKNGGTCVELPTLLGTQRDRSGVDNASFDLSIALDNQDIDYCIKGSPCDEDYDVITKIPTIVYKWEVNGHQTTYDSGPQYSGNFDVSRSNGNGMKAINAKGWANDIHGQFGGPCTNKADDGAMLDFHEVVAYRPTYEDPLPEDEIVEIEAEENFGNYIKFTVDKFDISHSYVANSGVAGAGYSNSTGCDCVNDIGFISLSSRSVTSSTDLVFAATFKAVSAKYNPSWSTTTTKSFGQIKIFNCESHHVNLTVTPMQVRVRTIKTKREWKCEGTAMYGYGYALCSTEQGGMTGQITYPSSTHDNYTEKPYYRMEYSCCES